MHTESVLKIHLDFALILACVLVQSHGILIFASRLLKPSLQGLLIPVHLRLHLFQLLGLPEDVVLQTRPQCQWSAQCRSYFICDFWVCLNMLFCKQDHSVSGQCSAGPISSETSGSVGRCCSANKTTVINTRQVPFHLRLLGLPEDAVLQRRPQLSTQCKSHFIWDF